MSNVADELLTALDFNFQPAQMSFKLSVHFSVATSLSLKNPTFCHPRIFRRKMSGI